MLSPGRHVKIKSSSLFDDRGSAVLEFMVFGLLLQISALTFFMQISSIQTSQLIAESIARHAMRSFVMNEVDPEATAAQVLQDFQVRGQPVIEFSCLPDCSGTGSILKIKVQLNSVVANAVFIR